MQEPSTPKGILDQDYADNRVRKKELGFRFRVRGEAVVWAARAFLKPAEAKQLSLLDMGAAEGRTLQYIDQQLGLEKGIGIEYNPDLIAKAQALPSHLELRHGDATHLEKFSDKSFAIVSALALLEHLPNPRLAIGEAARILKSGGLFVASSPVPFWDHLSTRLGLLAEDQHACDMRACFFRRLIQDVPEFKLLRFQKFMWAPIGFLPYLGLATAPASAFKIDRAIETMKLFNFLFVNQLVVAAKK